MQSTDPKDKETWDNLMMCFQDYWCLGKLDAPEDKWQPMIKMLCT